MRKFVRNVGQPAIQIGGVILLAVALRWGLVQVLGERLYRQVDLEIERLDALTKRPILETTLIMGDSTGVFSVDPNQFASAVNLSMADSTSVQSYYLLDRVLRAGGHPRCILLSYSFRWGTHSDYLWREYVARDFFRPAELEEIYETSRVVGDPPGYYGRWFYSLLRLISRRGLYDANDASRLQEALLAPKVNEARVGLWRKSLAKNKGSVEISSRAGFERPIRAMYESDPALSKTEASYFHRFLELIKRNKIRLYVLKVPFSQAVLPEAAAEAWRKYDLLMEESLRGAGVAAEVLAPSPLPESQYVTAGHLLKSGIDRITPVVRTAMKGCEKNL